MHRVNVRIVLTDEQMAQFTDAADVESSIVARFSEVYDAQGDPITPTVLGVTVSTDEPDLTLAHFVPMAGITTGDYLPSWGGFVVGTRRTAKRLYVTVLRSNGEQYTDHQALSSNVFAIKGKLL